MKASIFYSWQSDLPNNTNRSFIENAIKKAIKKLSFETQVYAEYDRDTLGITGSPDISDAIFEKIDKSSIFLCDISIVNSDYYGRKTPNPNVLVELGYAAKTLGWEKVICLFNVKYGDLRDLPFDLNHKRILCYNSDNTNEKDKVSEIIYKNVSEMFSKGILFNPLKDHVKGKVDYCLLEILKHISVILYDISSMSESLGKVNELLISDKMTILDRLKEKRTILGFFAYKNLNDVQDKLIELFNMISSSSNYPTNWAVTILNLQDWIRSFQWHTSFRREHPLYIKKLDPDRAYNVVRAGKISKSNRDDSHILLKKIDEKQGYVINVGTMIKVEKDFLISNFNLNPTSYETFCDCICKIIQISNDWLDNTGSEFILDPEYYHIGGPI